MTDADHESAIEDFRERAAVMEFEAGMRRANAESMALRDVVERRGKDAGQAVQAWRKYQCESYAAVSAGIGDAV